MMYRDTFLGNLETPETSPEAKQRANLEAVQNGLDALFAGKSERELSVVDSSLGNQMIRAYVWEAGRWLEGSYDVGVAVIGESDERVYIVEQSFPFKEHQDSIAWKYTPGAKDLGDRLVVQKTNYAQSRAERRTVWVDKKDGFQVSATDDLKRILETLASSWAVDDFQKTRKDKRGRFNSDCLRDPGET